ncbi:MAG: hypothetical protein ACI85O_000011 [Saprospiraceae bacterium]|jgi:hypothetical protein
MKQTLLFTFLLFVASISIGNAQNFEVDANPSLLIETDVDLSNLLAEPINHGTLTNNTSGEVSLGWQRTIVEAPEEWEFPVCDNNQCYFPAVDAAPVAFNVDGGGTSILDVHVRPNGVAGCGTVEIRVTPFSNTDNVLVVATYHFSINSTEDCGFQTSIDEVTISKVRVYPNPTSNLFQISELENIPEADEVAVYNIVGKKVRSFAPTASQYSVGDLPDGMYMVSVIDYETGILKTVRMSKNSLRP